MLCYIKHFLNNFLFKHIFRFSDWVFKVPHEYIRCEFSEDECEARGSYKRHEFNRFVDAINSIRVTCVASPNSYELPYWVWRIKGKLA